MEFQNNEESKRLLNSIRFQFDMLMDKQMYQKLSHLFLV